MTLTKLRLIYILAVIIFILIKKKKLSITTFVKKYIAILSAIIVSICILFYVGRLDSRVAFGAEFFSLILILVLLNEHINFEKRTFLYVCCGVVTVFYAVTLVFSVYNYQEYRSLYSQMRNSQQFVVKTNTVNIPKPFRKYVKEPLISEWTEYYNFYSSENHENIQMAAAFNRDSLAFIPERFCNEATANPDRYKDFSDYPNLPFYVKEYNGKQPKKVYFILNETDFSSLPFYIKPFANRMEKYTATRIESDAFDIVNIEGTQYLIVSKNFAVDDRFKNIEVITD